MKVTFYENNGDMLLMVVRNSTGRILFAHDYDGNYHYAEADAAFAADAQEDGFFAVWDGNILEDEDEMERYGASTEGDASDAFEAMIDEWVGKDYGNGIKESADMKLYRVLPEFTDRWFADRAPCAITAREISRLSNEWDVDISDLMEQVVEA